MEVQTVSLVVGTYNPRLDWLKNALKSSEGLFGEIILVDDCSDPPMSNSSVRHDVNKGFYNARNTGINMAKGEWIASLDDDDEFIRENVEKLKKFIEITDADIVHFPIVLFGNQDGIWANNPKLHEILQNNQIPSGSWFRKSVWEKLKGFQLPEGEDWDFWARATKHKMKFAYFPLPVYKHRMREDSMSSKWIGEKFLSIRKKVIEQYEKERV